MTLDEAIRHCEEVAEEKDMQAGFDTDYVCYQMSDAERNQCKKCAEEHRQLAEWLKDYKRLLERDSILDKIRTEIEQNITETNNLLKDGHDERAFGFVCGCEEVLKIMNKYKENGKAKDNILLAIPKDATNGKVIKTVFKPYRIEVFTQEVRVYFTKDYWQMFGIKWWNAPYKESEVTK